MSAKRTSKKKIGVRRNIPVAILLFVKINNLLITSFLFFFLF